MNKKTILVWLLTVITITVNAQTLLIVKDTTDAAISAAFVRLLNINLTTSANSKSTFNLVNPATYGVYLNTKF